MIQKINRMSLVEQVAAQIEELIQSERWTIGKKIPPETDLMEQFAVSRNTLREAIRALVHAGLLETKQGSGTIVRSKNILDAALKNHMKKATLLETVDVRIALEKQAVQLAAQHRTDQDLERLEAAIKACQQAAEKDDLDQFIESDIIFHKAIVHAGNNQLLIQLYEPLTDVLYAFIQDVMKLERPFQYEDELHTDLLEAIRIQDDVAATRYIESYLHVLKENVITLMEE